ncbi:MAG: penicillin-binding protein, partial [Lachnospiraceae bacterium]|nr:penicillin-binding protein [Lachnospiraceae bacterium]
MESSLMYASPGVSLSSTSPSANIPGMSNAGKSGTTSDNNDIWFVGYTPHYTAGVWSGCDENQKISAIGSSTSYHKKIWRKIMTKAHEGLADTGFHMPDSIETAEVCRKSGMLASPGVCELDPRGSSIYTEYFEKGTAPTELCTHHVLTTVCAESGGSPTEFCPEESKIQRAAMVLPANETGATDDSNYIAQPVPCPIHITAVETLPEENDSAITGDSSSTITTIPLGPGYLGPGYSSSGNSDSNNNYGPGSYGPAAGRP